MKKFIPLMVMALICFLVSIGNEAHADRRERLGACRKAAMDEASCTACGNSCIDTSTGECMECLDVTSGSGETGTGAEAHETTRTDTSSSTTHGGSSGSGSGSDSDSGTTTSTTTPEENALYYDELVDACNDMVDAVQQAQPMEDSKGCGISDEGQGSDSRDGICEAFAFCISHDKGDLESCITQSHCACQYNRATEMNEDNIRAAVYVNDKSNTKSSREWINAKMPEAIRRGTLATQRYTECGETSKNAYNAHNSTEATQSQPKLRSNNGKSK